ncbi:MAG: GntR family transcriptional regulator, partial [Chthoniobacterales bacterium]
MQSEPKSKAQFVYESIQKKIQDRYWDVGEQIPTEAEIAEEYACSRGTVSKAISMLANVGLVERRTRLGTRVLRHSLQSQKQDGASLHLDAYAWVYPGEQHEGIRRIGEGFQEAAHAAGQRIVALTTGIDFQQEAEMIGRLSEFDVKGALVYPILPNVKDRLHYAKMLTNSRFPLVQADISLLGFNTPSVILDGFHAGYTVTKHLLSKGFRNIGFLSNYSWVPSIRERCRGYLWALQEMGIEENPKWVELNAMMSSNFSDPIERAQTLTRDFLAQTQGIDCV